MLKSLEKMGNYIQTTGDLILKSNIASLTLPSTLDEKHINEWLVKEGFNIKRRIVTDDSITYVIFEPETSNIKKRYSAKINDEVTATCYKLNKTEDSDKESNMNTGLLKRPTRFAFHAQLELTKNAKAANDDEFIIEGLASTGEIDRDDDIVSPESFKGAIDSYMENPILCYQHNWDDPIGVVTYAKMVKPGEEIRTAKGSIANKEGGLYIKATISKTATKIRELIKEGVLKAFSIGFMVKDEVWDDVKGVRKITDMELFEISVVSIPSNRRSLFSMSKALAIGTDLVCQDCTDQEHEEGKENCCAKVHMPDLDEASEKVRKKIIASKSLKGVDHNDVEAIIKTAYSFKASAEKKAEVLEDLEPLVIQHDDIKSIMHEKMEAKNIHIDRYLGVVSHEQKVMTTSFGYFEMSLYCKALKTVCESEDWKTTRIYNYSSWQEKYTRPVYGHMETGRDKKEELLIEGFRLIKNADEKKLAVHTYTTYNGFSIDLYYDNDSSELASKFLDTVNNWVSDNNWFKGEKISYFGKFLPIPDVEFGDIRLDEKIKKVIKVGALEFFDKEQLYKSNKIDWKRGLIFTGPPGTGKTMLGKALLRLCKSTFIWVTADELNSAKGLFAMARKLAPCIIYAEDVDGFIEYPSNVDAIKVEMDGMKSNNGIVTILCTNFPDKLPKALIDRPGRFDDVLKFDLPNEKYRFDILQEHSKNITIEDKDTNLLEVARLTEGFSGSHLKELIVYALLLCIDENRDIVTAKDLLDSLDKINKNRKLITDISTCKSMKKDIDIKFIELTSKLKKVELPKVEEVVVEEVAKEKSYIIPKDIMDEIIRTASSSDADLKEVLDVVIYMEELMTIKNEDANRNYYLRKAKQLLDQEEVNKKNLMDRFGKVLKQVFV